jgi:hypothetical protein
MNQVISLRPLRRTFATFAVIPFLAGCKGNTKDITEEDAIKNVDNIYIKSISIFVKTFPKNYAISGTL